MSKKYEDMTYKEKFFELTMQGYTEEEIYNKIHEEMRIEREINKSLRQKNNK